MAPPLPKCPWFAASLLFLAAAGEAEASRAVAFSSSGLALDPVAQATAGARAAVLGDLSSGFANPAAAGPARPTLGASHLEWAGGLAREWVGLGTTWGGLGASLDLRLLRPTSPLARLDEDGNETGTFAPVEFSAGFACARGLGRDVKIGAGIRYFRLEDPTRPLTGLGFSAGAHWQSARLRAGIAATDIGSAGREGARYQLPTALRAGIQCSVGAHAWAAGGIEGTAQGIRLRSGIGVSPVREVELLAGTEWGAEPEGGAIRPSGGVRLRRGDVALAYAWHPAGDLGATHHLGIELTLPEPRGR